MALDGQIGRHWACPVVRETDARETDARETDARETDDGQGMDAGLPQQAA